MAILQYLCKKSCTQIVMEPDEVSAFILAAQILIEAEVSFKK